MNGMDLNVFYSRKNRVFLEKLRDGLLVIRKEYSCPHKLRWEVFVLNALANRMHVPRVLNVLNDRVLYLEYIDGLLLRDCPVSCIIKLYPVLLDWLRKLHSLGFVKGDCNARNFIIRDNRVYGVDFEEARVLVNERDVLLDIVDFVGSLSWIFWESGERALFNELISITPILYGSSGFSSADILCALIDFYRQRMLYRPEYRDRFQSMIEYYSGLLDASQLLFCGR